MILKRKVLFLCTGNSCRSQIAEAIVNFHLGSDWEAHSAGTAPTGFIHQKALVVLEEIGIDHTGKSKHVDDYKNNTFDVVITVCDSADETCPVWLGEGNKTHIGFMDPASATGTEEEILTVFRDLRTSIENEILHFLKKYADIS